MKKMFFTAIAMVAFSGAGMANTKEEVKSKEAKEKSEKKEEIRASCEDAASAGADAAESWYHCLTDQCFTAEGYARIYNSLLNLCNN